MRLDGDSTTFLQEQSANRQVIIRIEVRTFNFILVPEAIE